MPSAKSQDIRRAAETEANLRFTEQEKSTVADYLAHSEEVAKKHYRVRTASQVVDCAILLQSLCRYVSFFIQ